jgi:multidrug resistance protein MdtO
MTTTTVQVVQPLNTSRSEWWELLRGELTLAPERTARMVRMTALVILVVLISMALRVPEAALSGYMVFFITKEDSASTVKTGIALIVIVTLAVLVGLLWLSLTAGQPALRLSGAAGMTFVAMYAQRRSPKLGLVGFAVGFIVTMFLVYVEVFRTPEVLVRVVCWIWVVIAYPAALIVISEGAFGEKSEELFRRGLAARLDAAGAFLQAGPEAEGQARKRIERLDRIGAETLASSAGQGPGALVPLRTTIVREIERLLTLLRKLPPLPGGSPLRGPLRRTGDSCLLVRRSLLGEPDLLLAPPELGPEELDGQLSNSQALAAALPVISSVKTLVLGAMQLREAQRNTPELPKPSPPTPAEQGVQQREAVHFASKVTLAAMTAYITYTALDWTGIHTAMITCFFVAQESVAATIHKLTLRIIGALIGGTLGIAALILLLPRLDSGGGLAVLVGAVTLLATWFATGSQRISYAGWQIALAFYLTVLHGFSRTTKLVVARDRLLGIILGNILISVIFANIWPARVKPKIRDGIARSLEALAALVGPHAEEASEPPQTARREQAFLSGLSTAQQFAFFARFEAEGPDQTWMLPMLGSLFIPARALSLSVPWGEQVTAALPESERWKTNTISSARHDMGQWLSELAASVREDRPPPRFTVSEDAFDDRQRSVAAVRHAGVSETSPRLPMQLECLALIREQVQQLAGAAR